MVSFLRRYYTCIEQWARVPLCVPILLHACFLRDIVVSEKNSDSGVNTVKTPASIAVGFIYAYVFQRISYAKFDTLAYI